MPPRTSKKQPAREPCGRKAPTRTPSARKAPTHRAGGAPDDVEALLAGLKHSQMPAIHALREIIRGVDPRIEESVKWNAPSFATSEHFATFHLRAKEGVQVVLHLGAKARPDARLRGSIADPAGLLDWRAPDRAIVTFRDPSDVEGKRSAFAAVIRQWIRFVPTVS
jgi:hypothetical protein